VYILKNAPTFATSDQDVAASSLFSMTYPVKASPPSSTGGDHVIVAESLVITSGPTNFGFPGGPTTVISKLAEQVPAILLREIIRRPECER